MKYVFFNDTATTEIYTLSLHDALPIFSGLERSVRLSSTAAEGSSLRPAARRSTARRSCASSSKDRKSTRLNSSHANISYAVFCLKKKTSYVISFWACYQLVVK